MTGNQEIIDGLQKEIALLEKVVEAKNDLISQQEKVILQLQSQIQGLTDMLNDILAVMK